MSAAHRPFRITPNDVLPEDEKNVIFERIAKSSRLPGKSPTYKEVEDWINHPDERVVILLLEKRSGDLSIERREQIWKRALADARSEKVVWTPLLDVIARTIWKDTPARGRPANRIKRMQKWLQEYASPKDLEDLLRFTWYEVWEVAAEHGGNIPPATLEKILERSNNHTMSSLASNPNLSPENCTYLLENIIEGLSGPQRSHRANRHTLVLLFSRQDYTVPREIREKLFEMASTDIYYMFEVFPAFLADPRSTLEELEKIYDLEPRNAFELAKRPGTPVELHRRIAEEQGDFSVRTALAENPEAIGDPEVRRHLRSTTSGALLTDILKNSSPEEKTSVFRLMTRRAPSEAVEALKEGLMPKDYKLSSSEMAALLSRADEKTRKEIFLHVSEITPRQPSSGKRSL